MNKYVIIVAGGKGLRMGGEIPKQFLPLSGKPVLMRTAEAFYRYDNRIRIVLVLPADQQTYWQRLCERYQFTVPHQVAAGGETRFQSVKNGLTLIKEEKEGIVGVHDGVRPFVSKEMITRCYEMAETKRAVIPVTEMMETVRHTVGEESETVPRDEYKLVQTPQVFAVSLLKKAYRQTYSSQFTDDASVVEALGEKVYLTEGNWENIKITTPFDWQVGELLAKRQLS